MVHCQWLLNFNRVKWWHQYQLMNRSDHHLANLGNNPSSIITCLCMFVQIYTEKNTNITGYSSALPVIMGGKVKKIPFQFLVYHNLRLWFILQFLISNVHFLILAHSCQMLEFANGCSISESTNLTITTVMGNLVQWSCSLQCCVNCAHWYST